MTIFSHRVYLPAIAFILGLSVVTSRLAVAQDSDLTVDQAFGNSPYFTPGNSPGAISYGNITVGDNSGGVLYQQYGDIVFVQQNVVVGNHAGSVGSYYFGYGSGTNTAYLEAPALVIGNQGQGTFIQAGNTVASFSLVSLQAGSSSTGGTYFLRGGEINVGQIGQNIGIAASGSFYFNGGVVITRGGSNGTFMQGLAAAYVQVNGAKFNSNGYDVTVAQPLLHSSLQFGDTAIDGGLTKQGNGTLTLTGANTFNGGVAINGGALNAGHAAALGNGGTISFGGGTLQYSAASAGVDFSSRFSPAGNQAIRLDTNSQNVTIGYGFGGNGTSLTKLGGGTLTINGANTYTGATNLQAGTVLINNPDALSRSGAISFGGGTLQYGDASHTDSQYNTADFSPRFSTADNQRYNIDTGSHNITYGSALTSNGGVLNKLGTGTLTLEGRNTYTGETVVRAGTLLLNNANTGAGNLVVDGTGAALGGKGSTTSAVTIATGSLNPGGNSGAAGTAANTGTLSVGRLELKNSSRLTLDVASVTNYDRLLSAGDVILGNSTLGLSLNPNAIFVPGDTLGLIHLTGGRLNGTFAGIANGGIYTFGDDTFRAVYTSTDFQLVAVPEPATWVALLFGIGGLLVRRKRSDGQA